MPRHVNQNPADRPGADSHSRAEADVQPDDVVAGARHTGGLPDPDAPDQNSTTGTTPNDTFVGRVAGADVGYAEETGAERRAAAAAAAEAELEARRR